MVLAPKTEHGMKARFKCKDGFKLITPEGKDVIDENEHVLTCAFGNWTGITPACQEMFCAFPGYVDHGKILLIGNMGLYDYRPYVKKVKFNYYKIEQIYSNSKLNGQNVEFLSQIMNNKQIMYDCDKGYILNERGPVGATCVAGLWRPTELPECLPGLHPRLRWSRRRRDVQNPHTHKLLRNFGRFKREMREMLRKNPIEDPFPLQRLRTKRRNFLNVINDSNQSPRKNHKQKLHTEHSNHKWHLAAPAILRFRRNSREKRYPDYDYQFARSIRANFDDEQQQEQYDDAQQRAYNKYYQKIKQKHRNYINNLLRASHRQSVNDDEPLVFDNLHNTYRSNDFYKTPAQDPFDEINAYSLMQIPLPNINQNRNVYVKKELHDGIVNNTFVGRNSDTFRRENPNQMSHEFSNEFIDSSPKHHERNVSNVLELLRSQMIRKRRRILNGLHQNHETEQFHRIKRSPRSPNPKKGEDSAAQQDEDGRDSDTENSKKSRPKEPCEV